MKAIRTFFSLYLLLVLLLISTKTQAADFSLTPMVGYSGGLEFQLSVTTSNFAQGFPFKAKFGIGRISLQPGHALQARRIFINDARNGIPEKKGWIWDYRLDLLFKLLKRTYIYGGVRYARFTGNFNFVGGNEDFDVISNQWGLGGGLESHFRMSSRIDLVVCPGVDYFLQSELSGHDTAYSPNGESRNPRKGYTYNDADEAIHQPKLMLRMLVGIKYRFGR